MCPEGVQASRQLNTGKEIIISLVLGSNKGMQFSTKNSVINYTFRSKSRILFSE